MKIQITSEMDGQEVIACMVANLASSNLKITAKPEEIIPQVQNKEGKWVQFEATKIKFVYNK